MGPRLRAGVQWGWRGTGELHVSAVDPLLVDTGSVVVKGAGPGADRLLGILDGTFERAGLLREARAFGLDPPQVTTLLDQLARSGLLVSSEPDQLFEETGVTVHGSGPLSALVASLLGAAGVARVHVPASGTVGTEDCVPGGFQPVDVARPRSIAAQEALCRAAPWVRTNPVPGRAGIDCVVFTDGARPDRTLTRTLTRGGTPHVFVAADGETGRLGPFVIPGRSACLGCIGLHRRDLDPSWNSVGTGPLANRTADHRAASPPSLLARVAGAATEQVVTYLVGQQPESTGAVLEIKGGSLRPRRQLWPPHPDCRCAAAYGGIPPVGPQ